MNYSPNTEIWPCARFADGSVLVREVQPDSGIERVALEDRVASTERGHSCPLWALCRPLADRNVRAPIQTASQRRTRVGLERGHSCPPAPDRRTRADKNVRAPKEVTRAPCASLRCLLRVLCVRRGSNEVQTTENARNAKKTSCALRSLRSFAVRIWFRVFGVFRGSNSFFMLSGLGIRDGSVIR